MKFLLTFALFTIALSGCQSQPAEIAPTLPVASTPTLVADSPVVSAERCASASGPAPALMDPNSSAAGVDVVGLIDRSLGGGVAQSREFTIELLLYCNSAYGPLSMEPYFLSDVKGLAVYYRWRYEGTLANGPVSVFSGFAPELQGRKEQDPLRQGQMNPFGSNAEGIHVPANKLSDLSKGMPFQYVYILQGPSGQFSGAALSFDLQPVADGLQPNNVTVTALSDKELESLKSTLPSVGP